MEHRDWHEHCAAIRRSLDAIRARNLRRLAEQDPTYTRLREALARERDISEMDTPALLAYLTELEARFMK